MIISEQESAAELAAKFINRTNKHVFLTGKAGTGKTTFLRHIIRHTHKNAVIAAPTGIAAINAGGVTLHSLFQLPFGTFAPENRNELVGNSRINTPATLSKSLHIRGNKRQLLQELELLIIDEVSMLRADILDAIDLVLRMIRRSSLPFGGLQILFIGDLLQLPPVVKEEEWSVLRRYYNTAFFFEALALKREAPVYIELDKIYRQSDDVFIRILNNLRHNNLTEEDQDELNRYYKPHFEAAEEDNYIHLTTHNAKADRINNDMLRKQRGKSFFFEAEINGEFGEYAYPVEKTLELRDGAQVMFIKNDPSGEQRFFNGKIGKISRLETNRIEVVFEDGGSVDVEPYEWRNIRYRLNEATQEIDEEEIGSFSQYPIRLAWAITVHKSQGLTFTKAIIDLGSAFAPGQAYVALSRLTSLEGLVLTNPIRFYGLEQDESVLKFSESRNEKGVLIATLEEESKEYIRSYLFKCFSFSELRTTLLKTGQTDAKDEERTVRKKQEDWLRSQLEALQPVEDAANKFIAQIKRIMQAQPADMALLYQRIQAAKNYFKPLLTERGKAILNKISELKSEKRTKEYTADLSEAESLFYKKLQQITKAEALLRSVVEKTEIVKEEVSDKHEREQEVRQAGAGVLRRKAKGTQKKKGESQELSLSMFKAGKSIEEIAKERGLTAGTIEGHLARYVMSGELDIDAFISPEKRELILKAAEKAEDKRFSVLRESLSEAFTYNEIRLTLAHAAKEAEPAN